MTLYELGTQYIESAQAVRQRVCELRALLKKEADNMTEKQKLHMRRRIYILDTMADDSTSIGRHLLNYYGGN